MDDTTNQNDTTAEAAYDAMLEEHIAEIVRVFGEEAANNANIGWADSGSDICSKVYGEGFLSTDYDEETFAVLGHRTEWL